jgi:hypothetical protein
MLQQNMKKGSGNERNQRVDEDPFTAPPRLKHLPFQPSSFLVDCVSYKVLNVVIQEKLL